MGGCALAPRFFFFNDTATTEIYTLSLHDALPICFLIRVQHLMVGGIADGVSRYLKASSQTAPRQFAHVGFGRRNRALRIGRIGVRLKQRSEEHTSELQSLTNLVCRLLLEKKQTRSQHRTTAARQKRKAYYSARTPGTGIRPRS